MRFLLVLLRENEFSSLSYNVSIRDYVDCLRMALYDGLSGIGKCLVNLIVFSGGVRRDCLRFFPAIVDCIRFRKGS